MMIGDVEEKIDSLANYQISEIINNRLKKRLQHISDSAGINAFIYIDQITKSRKRMSNYYVEIIDRYQGKKMNMLLLDLIRKNIAMIF